jgi:branched-chain amino acid transport system ATP-binding protein
MLKIENLNAGYGRLHILFNVTANIEDVNITIIVWPNGSGKSTLLKTIMGMTKIYSGKILIDNIDIVGQPPHVVTKLGVAYLPQTDNVFANLTVKENLLMAGYVLSRGDAEKRSRELLEEFSILKKYVNRKANTLSGGERQMLAMAMALMRRPRFMLFDEPTGNLAPKIAIQVLDKIVSLRDDYGITILVVEQNARMALEKSDNAILLVSGRVVYSGSSPELLSHPELGKVYLGVKAA